MKLLLLNQPIKNRGDESAHKALVRRLAVIKDMEIDVLLGAYPAGLDVSRPMEELNVHCPNVKYDVFRDDRWYWRSLKIWKKFNVFKLTKLSKAWRLAAKKISEADVIVCAPGGMNLGGFKDWTHLAILWIAKLQKKKIIYWGRSIGPFSEDTPEDIAFKAKAKELLDYCSFVSLRDEKSVKYAKELGIKYSVTLDSAFLQPIDGEVPNDIKCKIGEDYIVFVPNPLRWHPSYKSYSQNKIDGYFNKIVLLLKKYYPKSNIVLLPQTSDDSKIGEMPMFKLLAEHFNNEGIAVLPDNLSSDMQQLIIKGSRFVVGCRYHSIIFAINNLKPFISLSYEHKMDGMIQTLHLEKNSLNVNGIFGSDEEINRSLSEIEKLIKSMPEHLILEYSPNQIVDECLNEMLKQLNNK